MVRLGHFRFFMDLCMAGSHLAVSPFHCDGYGLCGVFQKRFIEFLTQAFPYFTVNNIKDSKVLSLCLLYLVPYSYSDLAILVATSSLEVSEFPVKLQIS